MNTKKIIALGLLYTTGIMGIHNVCDAAADGGKSRSGGMEKYKSGTTGKFSTARTMSGRPRNEPRHYIASATQAQNLQTVEQLVGRELLQDRDIIEITVEQTDNHSRLNAMDSLGLLLSNQLTEALATPGNTVNIDAQLQEYNPQQMTTNLANLYGAGAYILLIKGDRITVIAKDLIMDYAQSTHDLIEDRYFRRKLPFFAAQGNQLYFMPRKKSFWTRGKIAAAAIGAMGASVFAFLKLRTPNATDLVPAIMDHDDAMALAYDPPPAGPDATDLDMYNPPNPNAMALGTGHDAIDVIAIDGGPDAVAPYISPTRTPAAIAAATAVAKPIAEPTTVETTISPVALQRLTETAAPTPEPTAMPTPEPTVPAAALWHQALNGSPIITCAMISDKYKETYPDAGYFAIRSKVADVLRDAGTLFPGYTKASKFQRIMVEREEYQVKVGELIRNDILQLATKGK